MTDPIPAWRIRAHALCPRKNYFEREHGGGSRDLLYEVALRRHEALREAGCLERDPLLDAHRDLAERAREEYRHVWGEEPGELPEDWVREEVDALLDRHDGYVEALEAATPSESGVTLCSGELGLSGRVDKLRNGSPVLVRTGSAPTRGVWRPDRAQATAYCLLLSEDGDRVTRAEVEYAREHEVRETEVKPYHRRRVLEMRDEVRRVLRDRKLPGKRNEKLCPNCPHEEECGQEPRTLTERFLG